MLPLPQLREIMSGAAPLGPELASAAMHRLGLRELRQGYGMTEMSPVSHMMPLGRGGACIGSIGELMPSMRCKVVAVDSGREVGVGEVGELWLAGPNIMQGYLNRPEATASTIDAEGYLHTGDVGYVDAEGRYYVVDRVKELIKVKGFQVAPAELEAILLSDARVADAAVIGVPDQSSNPYPNRNPNPNPNPNPTPTPAPTPTLNPNPNPNPTLTLTLTRACHRCARRALRGAAQGLRRAAGRPSRLERRAGQGVRRRAHHQLQAPCTRRVRRGGTQECRGQDSAQGPAEDGGRPAQWQRALQAVTGPGREKKRVGVSCRLSPHSYFNR